MLIMATSAARISAGSASNRPLEFVSLRYGADESCPVKVNGAPTLSQKQNALGGMSQGKIMMQADFTASAWRYLPSLRRAPWVAPD